MLDKLVYHLNLSAMMYQMGMDNQLVVLLVSFVADAFEIVLMMIAAVVVVAAVEVFGSIVFVVVAFACLVSLEILEILVNLVVVVVSVAVEMVC